MEHTNGNLARRRFLGLTVSVGAGLALPPAFGAAEAAYAATSAKSRGGPKKPCPPTFHSTTEWGAVPPTSPIQVLAQNPTKLLIHHTATDNSADTSLAHALSLAKSIQTDHLTRANYIDTGHHFLISRGLHVVEGRHRSVEITKLGRGHVNSAHCIGQNDIAVGIENEGLDRDVEFTDAQYKELLKLSLYVCSQFGIRSYQVYGHREFNNTECPGDKLFALLPKLRADIAAVLGGDPTAPAWPLTKKGEKSERAKALQFLLRYRGFSLVPDGDFGGGTDAAVRQFQKLVGASADGIAGRQTWGQLCAQFAEGSSGDAVNALQTLLIAKGVLTGPADGGFGPGTKAAVVAFQTAKGLPADGLVDPRTWSHLVA